MSSPTKPSVNPAKGNQQALKATPVTVMIGGQPVTFDTNEEAIAALMAENAKTAAERDAAIKANDDAAAGGFALKLARYSRTHAKTIPALKGELKGEVAISLATNPYGVSLKSNEWFELLSHSEEITDFFEKNRKVLADALEKVAKVKGAA